MRIGEALIRDATKVTKEWTRYKEQQIRSYGRARWTPPREIKDTIKAIAWRVMAEAYRKAAGSVGMAFPRQVFYAARPLILAALGLDAKKLRSVYFTQTLLPDYIADHRRETDNWDLLWDDRGHFTEPHTRTTIGLGTLAVRNYLSRCGPPTAALETVGQLRTAYPTSGPQNRYRHVLLIEKEGFRELFKAVRLAERYDLAIMSSKGMNTTAARRLVEDLPSVRFLVLHDMDKAGFSILGTLRRSTRRYHFHRRADIIDLGIRLADVEAEGLESEPVEYTTKDPEKNLRLNGATDEEIEFLVGGECRVELNAFTNDHFIRWLEAKLVAAGVQKLIPDDTTLSRAYSRAVYVHAMNAALEKADRRARTAAEATVPPVDLRQQVERTLTDDPALSWDEALATIAADDDDGDDGSDDQDADAE